MFCVTRHSIRRIYCVLLMKDVEQPMCSLVRKVSVKHRPDDGEIGYNVLLMIKVGVTRIAPRH